jgi:RNA polymerase sigma-70 factor, ECF subfamily
MDSRIPSSSDPGDDSSLPGVLLDFRTWPLRHDKTPALADSQARATGSRAPSDAKRERARSLLFRRETLRRVRRWLRKLGVFQGDLDDVVQSVMLQALRSFARYDTEGAHPERWLNAIAVHVASHHNKKALRRKRLLIVANDGREGVADDRPTPEEALAAAEAQRELHVALAGVRPHRRWVLVAHDLDEIPMAQLARTRGMSVFTTYKWRVRAIAEMRAAFARSETMRLRR